MSNFFLRLFIILCVGVFILAILNVNFQQAEWIFGKEYKPIICPTISATFSPKGETDTKILNLINNAKEKIEIAMYSFTDKDIFASLELAQKRGVKISVVQDKGQAAGKYSLVYPKAKLISGTGRGVMHNKFAIIDDCLITGSTNWTTNGFLNNWENGIFICNDNFLVNQYTNNFEKMWLTGK